MVIATLREADSSGSTEGKTLAETKIVQEEIEGRRINNILSGFESPVWNVCNRQRNFWGGRIHITHSTQPSNTTLQFANELWVQTVLVPHVFNEYVLKGTFIEEFTTLILQTTAAFRSTHKGASLQKLLYEANYLRTLQEAVAELVQVAKCTWKNDGKSPTDKGKKKRQ